MEAQAPCRGRCGGCEPCFPRPIPREARRLEWGPVVGRCRVPAECAMRGEVPGTAAWGGVTGGWAGVLTGRGWVCLAAQHVVCVAMAGVLVVAAAHVLASAAAEREERSPAQGQRVGKAASAGASGQVALRGERGEQRWASWRAGRGEHHLAHPLLSARLRRGGGPAQRRRLASRPPPLQQQPDHRHAHAAGETRVVEGYLEAAQLAVPREHGRREQQEHCSPVAAERCGCEGPLPADAGLSRDGAA